MASVSNARKNVTIACVLCRKRHIKCDDGQPCNNCERKRVTCERIPPKVKRGRQTGIRNGMGKGKRKKKTPQKEPGHPM